jgi:hypothetical protein
MKYYLLFVITLFIHSNAVGQNLQHLHEKAFIYVPTEETTDCINQDSVVEENSEEGIVYICTGSSAYAFHSYSNCPGLNNCRGSVISIDQTSATSENSNYRQRVHCCRCWTGVSRCIDDNSSNTSKNSSGGGGGAGAGIVYLVIAAAVIVVGVFLISNDIHIAPAISYYRPNIYGSPLSSSDVGIGGVFQLRKRFKNSALEYGVSLFRYENITGNYSNVHHQFGGQISYVHNIFPKKMPHPRFNLYVGPTIKWVNTFGLGGIIGGTYRIADWIHADFRYELTNQSNHFQVGLIFTYQKKYFWLKKNRY